MDSQESVRTVVTEASSMPAMVGNGVSQKLTHAKSQVHINQTGSLWTSQSSTAAEQSLLPHSDHSGLGSQQQSTLARVGPSGTDRMIRVMGINVCSLGGAPGARTHSSP